MAEIVCRDLNVERRIPDLKEWEDVIDKVKVADFLRHDAYLSVTEAVYHAGYKNGAAVRING